MASTNSSKIPNRQNWSFVSDGEIGIVKSDIEYDFIGYNILKLLQMFKYNNLPDTLPQEEMEKLLFINGYGCVTKVNDKLYALRGSFGGKLDGYYRPTEIIVANPWLSVSKTFTDNKDCVIIKNDSMYAGLIPMLNKYAVLTSELDFTFRYLTWVTRITSIVTSQNDNISNTIKTYFDEVIEGQKLGSIVGKQLEDILETHEFSTRNSNAIKDCIELQQYLKASMYNELGLKSSFNMKREALSSEETAMDEDILLPLVDEMLRHREENVKRINDLYGTNITVELNSSWKNKRIEIEQMQEIKEKEIEEPKEKEEIENEPKDETEGNN